MLAGRKLARLVAPGIVLGAALALVAPPSSLIAVEEACRCDDDGSGAYKCNAAQDKCLAGSEACVVTCIT